jgi:hypothetical protein
MGQPIQKRTVSVPARYLFIAADWQGVDGLGLLGAIGLLFLSLMEPKCRCFRQESSMESMEARLSSWMKDGHVMLPFTC